MSDDLDDFFSEIATVENEIEKETATATIAMTETDNKNTEKLATSTFSLSTLKSVPSSKTETTTTITNTNTNNNTKKRKASNDLTSSSSQPLQTDITTVITPNDLHSDVPTPLSVKPPKIAENEKDKDKAPTAVLVVAKQKFSFVTKSAKFSTTSASSASGTKQMTTKPKLNIVNTIQAHIPPPPPPPSSYIPPPPPLPQPQAQVVYQKLNLANLSALPPQSANQMFSMPPPSAIYSFPPPPLPGQTAAVKKNPTTQRSAAGRHWVDPSLDDWPDNDYRLFIGDLSKETTHAMLNAAFLKYKSYVKCKICYDVSGKTKGYGFVSLLDMADAARGIREMNDQYVGGRPIKVKRSEWRERSSEVVKKKKKEVEKRR